MGKTRISSFELGSTLSNLIETILIEANLDGTSFSESDLTGAKVTQDQLKQARSLKGATMPDGSIHP